MSVWLCTCGDVRVYLTVKMRTLMFKTQHESSARVCVCVFFCECVLCSTCVWEPVCDTGVYPSLIGDFYARFACGEGGTCVCVWPTSSMCLCVSEILYGFVSIRKITHVCTFVVMGAHVWGGGEGTASVNTKRKWVWHIRGDVLISVRDVDEQHIGSLCGCFIIGTSFNVLI